MVNPEGGCEEARPWRWWSARILGMFCGVNAAAEKEDAAENEAAAAERTEDGMGPQGREAMAEVDAWGSEGPSVRLAGWRRARPMPPVSGEG